MFIAIGPPLEYSLRFECATLDLQVIYEQWLGAFWAVCEKLQLQRALTKVAHRMWSRVKCESSREVELCKLLIEANFLGSHVPRILLKWESVVVNIADGSLS